jgi:uncharacterized damage-inducible protein DinB
MSDELRFPVGKFARQPQIDAATRNALIAQIAEAPAQLAAAVSGLTDAQLDTPYRPDGWTLRQVAHHVPDSHMNAYIRCKLAVTETNPPVKTYNEAAWAEQADARRMPVGPSMDLLRLLHERWVLWLRSLDEAAFARTAVHPDHGPMRVDDFLQLYAWHGRHHTAHVTGMRKRMGW